MVSSSTSCLPATKPVEGGQGSVMTVASWPLRRKQARPYQVISIGAADGSRSPDSTSPGARPMTPGLEGGRVEAETRGDLHLAPPKATEPSKPRACRTLRNLNVPGPARVGMAECADVRCPAPDRDQSSPCSSSSASRSSRVSLAGRLGVGRRSDAPAIASTRPRSPRRPTAPIRRAARRATTSCSPRSRDRGAGDRRSAACRRRHRRRRT